ncbi:hypothetical protein BJ138DRAFT_36096 [Hygrophoropsis aurantiaca]|uniref:Uncharacterized protein n=1 Tax=Hygrophoropsis aurantiaca TaxID=72124 RepID=A0ACB7ZTL7_9AGAM|nr:hypothetical protein BJ138DRAFT_36096 [Hygrophoropsis aurantiaca]
MTSSDFSPPRPDDSDKHSSQSPPSPKPESQANDSASTATSSELHVCQWIGCSSSFSDPKVLYNHLCNDHIGRKRTNNRCLTCKWTDCGTSCAKRDQITSHLRIHTPLKPYVCEICEKSFKRPQDLKKHEKIHTEEHHAQHQYSKAVTVDDPNYVARVRGDHDAPPHKGLRNFARTRPHADAISNDSHCGSPPTASPELEHATHHDSPSPGYESFLQDQGALESPKSEANSLASTRTKRSYDNIFEEFFADMKKRRVNPSYDTDMAERLNHIACAENLSHYDDFNPHPVAYDIQTPEELAAVNDFLVALGRDVTVPMQRGGQGGERYYPYFDDLSLNRLGLAGLPGLPTVTGATYPHDSGYTQANAQPSHYLSNTYPSSPGIRSSRPSVQQQYDAYSGLHTPTPSATSPANNYGMQSRHVSAHAAHEYALDIPYNSPHYHSLSHGPTSSHSLSPSFTPPSATPSHNPSIPDPFAQFDYVRNSRGPAPPVQLAAPEYTRNSMHTITPLNTASGSAPEPVLSNISDAAYRGPPLTLIHVSGNPLEVVANLGHFLGFKHAS